MVLRAISHHFICYFEVYPTLSEGLQEEWDEIEQARYEGLITEQVKMVDLLRSHLPDGMKIHFNCLQFQPLT